MPSHKRFRGEFWISPTNFARRVDYNPDYIRRLCNQGRIQFNRGPNGRIRIPISEVDRFVGPSFNADDFPHPKNEEERVALAMKIAESM